MFPYPLEDFLQVGQHGLFRGMVDIGKFLDSSLLAADAEILPEYQVLVCWKSRARLTPEGEAALTPENVFILTP